MSTNVAYNPPAAGRHYTVAELVARERAEAVRARAMQRIPRKDPERTRRIAPVGAESGDASGQQGTHVTDLLRREGIGYGGRAKNAPQALAAKAPKERTRGMLAGRAAVLFGLTVGGMIGLQSTVADAPDENPGPTNTGGAIAAPAQQNIDPRASTSETPTSETEPNGGGASPTVSTDVVLRDNTGDTDRSSATEQRRAGGADSGTASAGGRDAGGPATTTTRAPTPDSTNQQQGALTAEQTQRTGSTSQQDTPQQEDAPQREGTQQQETQQSTQQEEADTDEGGLVGRVLDPVTGTVSGVLDGGTGLLGG